MDDIYIEEEHEELEQTSVLTSLVTAVMEMLSPKAKLVLAAALLCLTLASTPKQPEVFHNDIVVEGLVSEQSVQSVVRKKLQDRLKDLAQRPIMSEVGEMMVDGKVAVFAQQVIGRTPATDLAGWRIYPDANGSLSWDYQENGCMSSISMGSDGFSWFMQRGARIDMKDNVELNQESIQACLHAVHMV